MVIYATKRIAPIKILMGVNGNTIIFINSTKTRRLKAQVNRKIKIYTEPRFVRKLFPGVLPA
jgi:hypothetical protein